MPAIYRDLVLDVLRAHRQQWLTRREIREQITSKQLTREQVSNTLSSLYCVEHHRRLERDVPRDQRTDKWRII